MIASEITIAVVESELPATIAYVARYRWTVEWKPGCGTVVVNGKHPLDNSEARLQGNLVGYRALPPAWRFIHPDSSSEERLRIARPGVLPGGIGSMFHENGIICAPFNRLAYAENQGPHSDWGGAERWLEVRGQVSATTLGEMIAQILLHLNYSPGWKT